MTARSTAAYVFDPEAMENALRSDPASTLTELASYVRAGRITLHVRNLQGVGSNDPEREHFLLSLDLGVRVVDPNAAVPAYTPDALLRAAAAHIGQEHRLDELVSGAEP